MGAGREIGGGVGGAGAFLLHPACWRLIPAGPHYPTPQLQARALTHRRSPTPPPAPSRDWDGPGFSGRGGSAARLPRLTVHGLPPQRSFLCLPRPTFLLKGSISRGRGAELISLSRSLPHLGSNRGDSESGYCDRAPGLGSGRRSVPKATTPSSPSPGPGHHHPSLSGLPQLSHHALLSFPDPSALGVVTRFGLNLGKRRRGNRRVCPGQGAHSAPPLPRSRSCC